MSSRALRKFLQGVTGDVLIEELPLPLATVAADLGTFREIVFRSGLLWQAVLTSISIPGIFPAQRVGHYMAVDGGVLNLVPVSAAADMDGHRDRHSARHPPERAGSRGSGGSGVRPPPSAIQVIMRSIEIMQSRLMPQAGDAATIIVRPELEEIPAPGCAACVRACATSRTARPRWRRRCRASQPPFRGFAPQRERGSSETPNPTLGAGLALRHPRAAG